MTDARNGKKDGIRKWKDVSKEEILKLKKEQCSKCVYFSRAYKELYESCTCDYILITGHRRGCSPLECKEKGIFKPKKGQKKKKGERPIV